MATAAASSSFDGISHVMGDPEEDLHSQQGNDIESLSTRQQTTGVTIMECDVDEDRDDRAAKLASCTESSLLVHIHHYGSYIKGMMSSQETGISEIQNSIKNLVENMTQEISEEMYQLLQMNNLFHELEPSGQEGLGARSNKQREERYILRKQQQIIQAQQRRINRLATIQENVQDTAAMVFTELVHPFQHLFIALPFEYNSGSYNGFRLFFLCEHGQRSTAENRAPLSNIHLARHEGYKLQDPNDFFKDYASYLVSIFYILKNGITSPGLNIPSLSHTTLADGVVEVQDILKLSDNTIQSLMNETISYMHNQGYQDSMKRMNSRLALDVIESTDLHPVLRYLKCYRRNGLGNLRQVITSGKFKWVCTDHSRERYPGAAQEYQDEEDEDDDEVYEDNMEEDVRSLDVRDLYKLAELSLLDGLNSMKWTDRERTVIAQNRRVEQDETVLQAIIGAVADPDKDVREAAVRVLHDSSKASRSARGAVIRAVYDTQWNVQEAAVQVLGDLPLLSRDMVSVVDALGYAAESNHLHVKRAATEALIKHATSETVLQYLVEIIRNDTHMNKVVATEVLASQSILPETIVEALIEALGNDSQEVRNSAVFALQSQCNLPRLVVQALLEKVQDEVSGIREAAVRVLGNQLEAPESLLSAFIASLQDDSRDVQEAAIQALGDKSDLPQHTIQELTSTLSHKRVSVRESSAKVLRGQSTLSEATIQALIVILNDESSSVREAAVHALGSQFLQSQLVIDALVSMLDDNDPKVRVAAVYSIGCKMKLSESAVQALIRTLDDQDVDVQLNAIQVLGGLTASSCEVVDVLLRLLESENEVIRNTTTCTLSRNFPLSNDLIEKLVTNLQDKRQYVLGNHSERYKMAVTALASAALDEDGAIRGRALSTLRSQVKLPEAAVLAMGAGMKSSNQLVKLDVLGVLSEHINSSEAAAEVLICSLCDPDIHIRKRVKETLSNLTCLSESSIHAFERVLNNENANARISALDFLSDHIQSSESVALTTIRALKDRDQYVRNTALEALRKNGHPESTVLLLIERLRETDRATRDEAINALGRLPNTSGGAAQKLVEYLRDGDREIRRVAVRLLTGQVKWSEAAVEALAIVLKEEEDMSVQLEASIVAANLMVEAVDGPEVSSLDFDDLETAPTPSVYLYPAVTQAALSLSSPSSPSLSKSAPSLSKRTPSSAIDQPKTDRSVARTVYKCDKCPREFFRPFSLKRHKMIHDSTDSIRAFKCGLCNAAFSRVSDLKRHQLRHTQSSFQSDV
ncbi:MAG: armadillo-type protein [Benniella sp.]|nr:MAG: armadillo-type protein [Benniella sp.]